MSNSHISLREAFSPPNQVAEAVDGRQEVQPRLLIVDDISDNRTVLKRRFERRGFDVTEAESGLIAIDLIERRQFDLVLLDVMMPGIDGMETLRRIRGRKSASALPVIMVTAKSESDNIVDALEQGANDYVTKPVDFAVALARVNTQLSRRRAEQQVALANEELRKANEDLERRVEERTHRLIDANQRLKEEIADREELQARSQYLAYHDSLTGLGNRLLFKEQLDEALKDVSVTPHPLAVLFVRRHEEIKIFLPRLIRSAMKCVVKCLRNFKKCVTARDHIPADVHSQFLHQWNQAIQNFRDATAHRRRIHHLNGAACQLPRQRSDFFDFRFP